MSAKRRQSKLGAGRHSDLLILADGRILAHNLTPAMARVLAELMPDDESMRRRTETKK